MVKNKRVKLTTVVFVLSVLLGIAIIVLPMIVGAINKRRSDEAIANYEKILLEQEEEREERLFSEADEYNQKLLSGEADKEKYPQLLDNGNGMIGYIEIPRINIRDPIYHSIEESVLQKGIGHLPTTSLPIGGKATHAALSGHRGLPSSRLFTDLDRVRVGDIILIKVLTRTLAYEVYDIEVVDPDSSGNLEVDPNDDLLTLITCTPYAVNTHRLLVHARRTEYKDEMSEIKKEFAISESDRILLIALMIVALILAVDIVVILKRRKREKESKKQDE
jgi:sortase A